MNNYVQPGNMLEFVAPSGGVTSGTPVKIQSLVVIPAVDAAEGDPFNALVVGVVDAAKATGAAWAIGEKVYWDDSAKKFTTTSGGNTLVGVAAAAAVSADATGKVRLDGVAR